MPRMAHSVRSISLVVCVLAAQHVASQDILSKLIPADTFFSGMKKDVVHGHLQRMLQMDIQREEPETVEDCSPAALFEDKKCVAKSGADSKLSPSPTMLSVEAARGAPNCKGPDCVIAPMPSSKATIDMKAPGVERQVKNTKVVTYGPMTQDAYERMVQRKRTALREELQKKGALTAELEAFLQTTGAQLKDAFGIPFPAGPSEPRARDDFEMRFQPQAPSPDPAIKRTTTSVSSETFKATATSSSSTRGDFEMRFEPQTPTMDPNALRSELEAFIAAASPAPQHAIHQGTAIPTTTTTGAADTQNRIPDAAPEPATEAIDMTHPTTVTARTTTSELDPGFANQQDHQRLPLKSVLHDAGVPTSGPARPPMTEQEAARLAAQQVANAAVREAALARKRQMVRELLKTGKKASVQNTATVSPPALFSMGHQKPSDSQQRRRTTSGNNLSTATTTGRATAKVMRDGRGPRTIRRVPPSSWNVTSYLSVAFLVAVVALVLIVLTAVMEDALVARPNNVRNGDVTVALPTQWLALTHNLWRRCLRAFAAARKQFTGHGSDLPMSANEGSGSISRAAAAATEFTQVFWSHLRHQHLGGAVSAAFDASCRTSAGGIVPDRLSVGGAAAAYSSPFAAPQFQQSHGAISPIATPPMSYVIEADGSAAATAALELNLRRRH
ncbi:hypothetical protein VaNZ11_016646 [Volvox africanus]|uniref:Uncharacterized protein n=1 Tax=Volvox africanus TaxID=51714 RepID=A0ABQ5SN51_9CHLO|nr:hypothetical protein VaNZ11_016646 [Volvox africanus]